MSLLVPVLLAARLLKIVRIVIGPDNHFLLSLDQVVGYIDVKAGVSPFMRANPMAVDPDVGDVVNCAKVQQQPLSLAELWRGEVAAIPAAMEKPLGLDTTGGRLGREGHVDRAIPPFYCFGILLAAIPVEGEIPRAIQRGPAMALEHRPWMDFGWQGFSPVLAAVWVRFCRSRFS